MSELGLTALVLLPFGLLVFTLTMHRILRGTRAL